MQRFIKICEEIITESIEPEYPKNVKRKIIYKHGTQNSKIKVKQYSFTTSKGNEVSVHFKDSENKSTNIIFYVNNTLYDSRDERDQEILKGVLGIILKVSKNYDNIDFEAYKHNDEIKIVKNLDIEPYKSRTLEILNKFIKDVEEREPVKLEPTEAQRELAKKLNRELKNRYDFNKVELLTVLNKVKVNLIDEDIMIVGAIDELKKLNLSLFDNTEELLNNLNNMDKRIRSHDESGYVDRKNRRFNIYKRLLDKYFSNEWDIKVHGNSFYLNRKS